MSIDQTFDALEAAIANMYQQTLFFIRQRILKPSIPLFLSLQVSFLFCQEAMIRQSKRTINAILNSFATEHIVQIVNQEIHPIVYTSYKPHNSHDDMIWDQNGDTQIFTHQNSDHFSRKRSIPFIGAALHHTTKGDIAELSEWLMDQNQIGTDLPPLRILVNTFLQYETGHFLHNFKDYFLTVTDDEGNDQVFNLETEEAVQNEETQEEAATETDAVAETKDE